MSKNHLSQIAVMKFRMDRIIRELVEEAYQWDRLGRGDDFEHRDRVFIEILIDLESHGIAMRYLDPKGRIAWRATPDMRDHVRDLRIDAEEELDDDA
jgi:hypothetical protein